MDIVTALRELTQFDHAVCDHVIVARHIDLQHSVLKSGSSFQGVYVGSIFVLLWTAAVVGVTIRSYRKRASLRPRERVWLYWGPVMCVLAVFSIVLQSMSLIEYAQTCDALLHRT
jgi:hypothetical protein